MRENREHQRYVTSLECTIAHGESRTIGWTRDLSRGGISIDTDVPIEISSVVDLALSVIFGDKASSQPLQVKAVVVWCTPHRGAYQVGAKFAMLSNETRAFLEVFLKLLDGTVDPIEDLADASLAAAKPTNEE